MLGGLGLVIVLMLVLLRFLRQLQRGGSGGQHNPKIIGSAAVGQRERVVLIEVANKVLVLGVTAQAINSLHSFDAAELPTPTTSAPPSGNEFATRLKAMLEKSRHGK